MKISIFFVGIVVLATASESPLSTKIPEIKIADKSFLEKQTAVVQLLWGVTQTVTCPKVLEIANSFKMEENLELFTNVDAVKHFINIYKYGTLSKEDIFTIYNEKHLKQAKALFDIFFYAKDFETFFKTACWARVNINSGQFVYAFSTAVAHRKDFKGIVLPAPYETIPHFFVDGEIIQKAYQIKFLKGKTEKPDEIVVINVNNTGLYPHYQYSDKHSADPIHGGYGDHNLNIRPEDRLAYFTEDVAINAYNYYNHLYNPFYLNSTYGYALEGRGELFFYYHQQILARYYLERISNNLPTAEAMDFEKSFKNGYNPNLRYPNGKAFPARPNDALVRDYVTIEHKILEDFTRRFIDSVDYGFIFTETGEKIPVYERTGIDYLGHIIQDTANSVHPRFYGNIYYSMMRVLGRIVDGHYNYKTAPGVLAHPQTALRDPLYYKFIGFINQLFFHYKSNFDNYNYDELNFPGVKVNGVEIDKLVTFFENYDIDISSVVSTKKILKDTIIKARQFRLNHKPFNYKINIESENTVDSVIRVFIGPKYDVVGKQLELNEKRGYMIEIDRFTYQVAAGANVIVRNSSTLMGAVGDQVTISELYKTAKNALEGNGEFHYEEMGRLCGFPNRFLLPKGKRGGLPLTLFVAVTPVAGDTNSNSIDAAYHSTVGCGTGLGLFPQDGNAMGFPFDRPIDDTQFFVPNFYEKDIIVFHKRADEIANSSS